MDEWRVVRANHFVRSARQIALPVVTEEICASKKFSYSLFLFGQLMGNDLGGSCGLQEGFNLEAEGGFLGSTGSGVF